MRSPSWLHAADAAAALRVSRATLYAYVSRGYIRSQATAGSTRERQYSRDDVERLRRRTEERRNPGQGRGARAAMGYADSRVGDRPDRRIAALLPRPRGRATGSRAVDRGGGVAGVVRQLASRFERKPRRASGGSTARQAVARCRSWRGRNRAGRRVGARSDGVRSAARGGRAVWLAHPSASDQPRVGRHRMAATIDSLLRRRGTFVRAASTFCAPRSSSAPITN